MEPQFFLLRVCLGSPPVENAALANWESDYREAFQGSLASAMHKAVMALAAAIAHLRPYTFEFHSAPMGEKDGELSGQGLALPDGLGEYRIGLQIWQGSGWGATREGSPVDVRVELYRMLAPTEKGR